MTLLFSSLNEHPIAEMHVSERGLAYGDGHFTTAKITDGCIEHIELHLARLNHAHKVLGLNKSNYIGDLPVESLKAYVNLVAKPYNCAVIKILITAGTGGRGYSRTGLSKINQFVSVSSIPEHYVQWQEEGITLGLSSFQLSSHPTLAGIKHLNRLEQVLIRAELDDSNVQDMLVCDQQGFVIESSCANVFWYKNGQWYTPNLSTSGVNGVIRQFVLSKLESVTIGNYTVDALSNIEAMFICNSVMEIVPIRLFQQRELQLAPVRRLKQQLI